MSPTEVDVARNAGRDRVSSKLIESASTERPSGGRKRIHITGAHRSGTTLMCAMMIACFDIDVAPADETRLRAPLPPGGHIACTKCADESDYAFWLLPFDHDLHVIQMVRDPRDVIVSRYAPSPESYFTNLQSWKRNRPAWRWKNHPRAHIVGYERLVTQPDEVQAELQRAMPFLRKICAFSEFSQRAEELAGKRDLYWAKAMHSIRPPGPDSIGRWREHLPRVKDQIGRHGDPTRDLIALGLERDAAWQSILKNVEPENNASSISETETLKSRATRTWRNLIGIAAYVLERRREKRLARAH